MMGRVGIDLKVLGACQILDGDHCLQTQLINLISFNVHSVLKFSHSNFIFKNFKRSIFLIYFILKYTLNT